MAVSAFDPAIEKFARAVDALGISEFRQGEDEIRLLMRRGKIVRRKTIDVGRTAFHPRHRGRSLLGLRSVALELRAIAADKSAIGAAEIFRFHANRLRDRLRF